MLPFIKKKDPAGDHSTPIDVKQMKKEDTGETITIAQVAKSRIIKPDLTVLTKNKYLIITIGSAVFCIAGFGFWIYVQFFLSP